MATFFLPLTLVLYFIGTVLFLVCLVRRSEPLAKTALGITGFGFLTHTCGLTLQMFMTGDFPIVSFHKALSFFSWSLVLVFLVVALRNGLYVLGAFILPLSFFVARISFGFPCRITVIASCVSTRMDSCDVKYVRDGGFRRRVCLRNYVFDAGSITEI